MPIIRRKNINRARDMETFQNRSRTSTTVVFWVMNTTKRLTKIKININLRFMFFTFVLMPGQLQGISVLAEIAGMPISS